MTSSQLQDPAKTAFFQELNDAIVAQSQLQGMLDQGYQFHNRLNEILTKLQQTISDYITGRRLQTSDILGG